MIHRLIRRK